MGDGAAEGLEPRFMMGPSLSIGLIREKSINRPMAKTIPNTNPSAAKKLVPMRPSTQAPAAPGATITSTMAIVLPNHSEACSQAVLLSGTNTPNLKI